MIEECLKYFLAQEVVNFYNNKVLGIDKNSEERAERSL